MAPCCRPSGGQDPALQRQRYAVFVVIGGDPVRMGLDLGAALPMATASPTCSNMLMSLLFPKGHHVLHRYAFPRAAHWASRLPLLQPGCTSSTA